MAQINIDTGTTYLNPVTGQSYSVPQYPILKQWAAAINTMNTELYGNLNLGAPPVSGYIGVPATSSYKRNLRCMWRKIPTASAPCETVSH